MSRRGISELSVDAVVLAKALAKLSDNEVITYSSLSELIKRDVRKEARAQLATARRMLLRDNHVFLDCIPTVGLKRIPADESAERIGARAIRRSHSAAQKGHRELMSLPADLSPEAQTVRAQYGVVLGIVANLSSCKTLEQVKMTRVADANGKLQMPNLLKIVEAVS